MTNFTLHDKEGAPQESRDLLDKSVKAFGMSLGGRTRAIQIGVICVTLSLMLTGLAGDQALFLALLAIGIGLASGISQPLSMVILAESVSQAQRAPSLAMRLMGNRLAQAVAPP